MFKCLNRMISSKENLTNQQRDLNCNVGHFVFNRGSQAAQKVVNFVNERRITQYTKLCAS